MGNRLELKYASKAQPQRALHHAGGAGAGRHAEAGVGLAAVRVEGHAGIDVFKVGAIE